MNTSRRYNRRIFLSRAAQTAAAGVATVTSIPAHVEIGHRSAILCHLGNIARWTGRRLRWDPESETFPDDGDANRFLDRPRRQGYELPTV